MELRNKIKLCEAYNQLLLKSQNKTLNIDLEQVKYILQVSQEALRDSVRLIEEYQTKNFSRLNNPENYSDDPLVEFCVVSTSSIFFRALEIYDYLDENTKPIQTTVTRL